MGSPIQSSGLPKGRLTRHEYVEGILRQDRMILSKSITLIESNRDEDQQLAEEILQDLLPHTGGAMRIGITGIPGVGKSTFIDTLGIYLIEKGSRIAVLAIDPSSQLTQGSILGDKTRMDELSRNPSAFIRPTATGNIAGGISHKTKESIQLCEAAGFNLIIIETVGVGQSEVAVRDVVDFFLLLLLAGAGDELQGLKRGIMEMADGVVITKADGENIKPARMAMAEYAHAMRLFVPSVSGWVPEVVLASSHEKKGFDEVWEMIQSYFRLTRSNQFLEGLRNQQDLRALSTSLDWLLHRDLAKSETLLSLFQEFEVMIKEKKISTGKAARRIWEAFKEQR
jgi:GTPase